MEDKIKKKYVNEHKLRSEMIKQSTIKNLRRKNLEVMIEKQIQEEQEQRKKNESAQQMNSTILALKTITFGIILRIAGAVFQSMLSLAACVVYVVSTYYENDKNTETIWPIFEIMFATFFSVDYCIGFYNAKNKKKFVVNILNIVDLITILPVFVSFIPGGDSSAGNFLKKFIGVVRVLRVFRVLRMYRLFNSQGPDQSGSEAPQSEVKRKIIVISATILASVFIATGIVYSFNQLDIGFTISMPDDTEILKFDSAFYFMIVTVSTVGYGDIKPGSDLARVIIGVFIILIIILVSKQTSELNELMKFNSQYSQPYAGPEGSHIILIGNITSNTLNKFLKEFYHPDHNMKEDMKVVLIQNHEPSKEIVTVLNNPKYEETILYIKGNIFREQTLKMAKIAGNKIFILCNQYSADSNKDDTLALLSTKAIHEFDPSSKIHVQLVDPEFLLHSWADWDVVMSTQAYKMGIIASNAFNPGFSTFVCNLIMSTSVSSNIKKKFPDWLVNYCNGLSQEFYCTQFNRDYSGKYIGKLFKEVVQDIYMSHGILLVGIKAQSATEQNEVGYHDILMNPEDYYIKPSDEGIIISSSQEDAENIFFTSGEYDDQVRMHMMGIENQVIITEQQIRENNISKQVTLSDGVMNNDHYYMWETDLRGHVSNHFIVFGQMDHLPALLLSLKHYTKQYVCFVSDKQPDERWPKLRRNFPNVIYLEGSLTDVEEIKRTAIESSFHAILLTWFVADSAIQDSGILPIVRILEENFKSVKFTLELVDEQNLKYLNYRPKKELGNMAFTIWPRYASSNVFFSSTMDYVMAQCYHMDSIVEIVGKLINSNICPNISGIQENNEISVIKIPQKIAGGDYKYVEIFKTLIEQRRQIIPLAIIRQAQENENELPYVLINPPPLTDLLKDDMILMMGNTDYGNDQGFQRITGDTTPEQYSKEDVFDNIPQNDEILELIKQLCEEDEVLNIQDPILLQRLEDEVKLPNEEREYLLKQNEELRQMVKEYLEMRMKLFSQ